MEHSEHIEPIEQTGHEVEDAHVLPVVVTLAGLAVGAMLVALLVYGIFRYLADHPLSEMPPNPMAETATQQFPPAPRLDRASRYRDAGIERAGRQDSKYIRLDG